jgi:hypothetical protein
MTFARIRFAVALLLFVGWLTWLAFAVAGKGAPVLSRAQLLNSTHLVYGQVTVGEDGLPISQAKVTSIARGEVAVGTTIEVLNLPAAMPAGAKTFPGTGEYLLPLIFDGKTYRIAGLPRSPGYEPDEASRPVIYIANDSTRKQLSLLTQPK